MRLVFFGPPGAGKGTLAAKICEVGQLAHLASGEMLREAVRLKTALGSEAEGFMNQGELVPDELVSRMIFEKLEAGAGGFILDGFPRTDTQAKQLDAKLASLKQSLDLAIYFKTSEAKVIERLSGRRVCEACGANYHLVNVRPAKEGICDRCGKTLIQRKDDLPETIHQRLTVYDEEAAPVLAHYKAKGLIRPVDGDLAIEPLHELLMKLFQDEGLLKE